MKKHRKKCIALICLMICIPMIGWVHPPQQNNPSQQVYTPPPEPASQAAPCSIQMVTIQTKDGDQQISLEEYLVGVVAAEMPASFEQEALKAQTVAAHTYALNRYGEQGPYPTSPAVFQAYSSAEQRQQTFGSLYQQKEDHIRQIVKQVENVILTYNDQPIVAAFHAMSGGHTESSENVWGSSLPYLSGTDSQEETALPNYCTDIRISFDQVKETLQQKFPEQNFDSPPNTWMQILSRTQADYADQVRVGSGTVEATQLRSFFSLPSADFTIAIDQNDFVFTCKGKGHGVGMSQYGANEMAKQGKSYTEILKHYYTGCSVKYL